MTVATRRIVALVVLLLTLAAGVGLAIWVACTRPITSQSSGLYTGFPTQANYPSPDRWAPADGSVIDGQDRVTLSWPAGTPLGPDEEYLVHVRCSSGGQMTGQDLWTKSTSLQLDASDYARCGEGTYYWYVTRQKVVKVHSDGSREGPTVGPSSPTTSFYWRHVLPWGS